VTAAFDELRRRLAEISDLGRAASILGWDQQTMMPPRGAAGRAEELATLDRVTHEKFTSPEIGRLLDELADFEQSHPEKSFEASLVRVTRRDWNKARKVPVELHSERRVRRSLAHAVWVRARKENDFASYLPVLRKNLDLTRRYIACFDGDYASRTTLSWMTTSATCARPRCARSSSIEGPPRRPSSRRWPTPSRSRTVGALVPIELQKKFGARVVRKFGSTTSPGGSIRPSTRLRAAPARRTSASRLATSRRISTACFATMHECGHGLYEAPGRSLARRSPLSHGTSLGMHESQSRMWENLVGRSDPFWRTSSAQPPGTVPGRRARV